MRTSIFFLVVINMFHLALGCSQSEPVAPQPVSAAKSESAEANSSTGSTRVKKVVFIGQKDSCKCTRERIDKAWPVVENTLKAFKAIQLRRIQIDVESEEADRYDNMKTIMVAPGIFLLDEEDHLVDMLQGEVKSADLLAALQK